MHNLYKLIENTLIEKWEAYPVFENKADFKTAIHIFTRIALEKVIKDCSVKDKEFSFNASQITLPDEIVDKVKEFTENQFENFRLACQSGFPFSLLDNAITKKALKKFLKRDNSILGDIIRDYPWISEKELDKRYEIALKNFKEKIVKACIALDKQRSKGDYKADYYLLWLIKEATGIEFDLVIPKKEFLIVSQIISSYLSECKCNKKVTDLLDFLFFKTKDEISNSSLCENFSSEFFDVVLQQLQNRTFLDWPNKLNCIEELLKRLKPEEITKALLSSEDPILLTIGNHLQAVYKATALKDSIPHFYALMALLPNFTSVEVTNIFHLPFDDFCFEKKKIGELTIKHVIFHSLPNVFVQDSFMIGGIPLLPELLETPVTTSELRTHHFSRINYAIKEHEEKFYLHFEGGQNVYIVDKIQGEYTSIKLSKFHYDYSNHDFHLSPEGFIYQTTNHFYHKRVLHIGNKSDQNSFFEMKTPVGRFVSLSTHCGFHFSPVANELTIVGPSGDQASIVKCIDVQAFDNKLYTIESDPVKKNSCLLLIRTLKIDNTVISNPEVTISLPVEKAFLSKMCKNGWLVLFTKDHFDPSKSSIIFINPLNQTVIHTQKWFTNNKYTINKDLGFVWTWNYTSKEVWKLTPSGDTLVGLFDGGYDSKLLHADADFIYYY